ncbi:MAG: FAD-dependent oxidoreductase, partial [archaeon]|nr:FAD-dependent oxidoreductase [archaeon]
AGLETTRYGTVVADENGATSKDRVFAGGDVVTGSATVISAMGAGKVAAGIIDERIR